MRLISSKVLACSASLVLCVSAAYAQTAPAVSPTPTATPAAAPSAAPARPPFVMPHFTPTPEQIAQEKLVEREPANPALPTIFIVSDSTADYNNGRNGEEMADIQGWGIFFPTFFDPNKVNVVNAARAGRSSRTYITQGFWDKVLAQMKAGDVVLIQLGQNDVFALNDEHAARGTIPGNGEETQEIDNMVTHQHEVVHTYGWYIRKIVADTKAKGATPILLSLTTRNVWKDGQVEVGVNNYRADERAIAEASKIDFVDVSDIIAREYQHLGPEKTYGLFHDHENVHMDTPGSFMAAYCTVAGLKALSDTPVSKYLAYMGQFVLPMAGQIPGVVIVPPAPPKASAATPAATPTAPAAPAATK
jgi:rhamnogalacturonan acetylesterase